MVCKMFMLVWVNVHRMLLKFCNVCDILSTCCYNKNHANGAKPPLCLRCSEADILFQILEFS
jgi:hypothetical protein